MKMKIFGLLILGLVALYSCDDTYDYVTEKEYRERELKLLDTFLELPTQDGSLQDSLKQTARKMEDGEYDYIDYLDNDTLGWAIYWQVRGTGDPIELYDEFGVEYREYILLNDSEDHDNPEPFMGLIANNFGQDYVTAYLGSFASKQYYAPFYLGLEEAMLNSYYISGNYEKFDEMEQLTFRFGDKFTMLLPTAAKTGSYGANSYTSFLEIEIGYINRQD